jgi:hypothetical protein
VVAFRLMTHHLLQRLMLIERLAFDVDLIRCLPDLTTSSQVSIVSSCELSALHQTLGLQSHDSAASRLAIGIHGVRSSFIFSFILIATETPIGGLTRYEALSVATTIAHAIPRSITPSISHLTTSCATPSSLPIPHRSTTPKPISIRSPHPVPSRSLAGSTLPKIQSDPITIVVTLEIAIRTGARHSFGPFRGAVQSAWTMEDVTGRCGAEGHTWEARVEEDEPAVVAVGRVVGETTTHFDFVELLSDAVAEASQGLFGIDGDLRMIDELRRYESVEMGSSFMLLTRNMASHDAT